MSNKCAEFLARIQEMWPEDDFGNNVLKEEDGDAIGYVCLMDAQEEIPAIYVADIQINHRLRGQGHGSAILDRLCGIADDLGVQLMLNVSSSGPLDDEALEEWYSRRGFTFDPETAEFEGVPMCRKAVQPAPDVSW